MSEHDMGLSKIKREFCYESAWLSRWTPSNKDAKCSNEINLPGDGQLVKESTSSMKLKGKRLSRAPDLFPNPDSAVQIISDMDKEPPIVAERVDSIDDDEGETSRSATQSKNVELYLNNDTNTSLLTECKSTRLDTETNSRLQVKRLKTNSSDYSRHETKSMMVVEEGPSVEKVNYYFHKIFGINKPGSRRNQNPSTSQMTNLNMGRGRGGEDVNPWIQRWCKKKPAETQEPRGGQEINPMGSVLEKQFPSIAALALVGRALSGLNPAGSRKINSLFVRNAQDLR